MDYPKQGIHLR